MVAFLFKELLVLELSSFCYYVHDLFVLFVLELSSCFLCFNDVFVFELGSFCYYLHDLFALLVWELSSCCYCVRDLFVLLVLELNSFCYFLFKEWLVVGTQFLVTIPMFCSSCLFWN